ncbi:hypothetical protein WA556_001140, partial [Blastocystis sp. ATCC 50177/Nand II]
MELTGKNQKKQYTIAPTLYTYYKNNILKNRVSRAASQVTQSLLECKEEEEDRDAYNEDIINLCAQPHPNPFFQSNSFLEIFEHQCQQMKCILASEPRLLKLKSPIYVFGDFHGNIQDLLAFSRILWPLGMHLTPGSFLFLGDYVDRGAYSIEVLTYLFAQKIMLPDKVFLLRGNHELRAVNGWESYYGDRCFLGQLKKKYGSDMGVPVWRLANSVFDYLPFAATIDDVIFCVHGGIPRPLAPNTTALESIGSIPCPTQVRAVEGDRKSIMIKQLANDLLWSDPAPSQQERWLDNSGFGEGERGPGAICFGDKAITTFLDENQLSHIVRAHEPTQKGVNISKGGRVITIFSTSRDHGCRDAFCGCILVDANNIIAINHPDPTRMLELKQAEEMSR